MDDKKQNLETPQSKLDAPRGGKENPKSGFSELCLALLEWAAGISPIKGKSFVDYFRRSKEFAALIKGAPWHFGLALVVAAIVGFYIRGHYAEKAQTNLQVAHGLELSGKQGEIRSLKEQQESERRRLDERIETKRDENIRLSRELSDCKIELAPIRALAATVFTNVPPHQQMQALVDGMRSLSNQVSLQRVSAWDFRLTVNGVSIDKEPTPLTLPTPFSASFSNILSTLSNRYFMGAYIAGKLPIVPSNSVVMPRLLVLTNDSFVFEVLNASDVTAENVTIVVASQSERLELSPGWKQRGHIIAPSGKTIPTHTVVAEFTLENGANFLSPPLKFKKGTNSGPIDIDLSLSADRSQAVNYKMIAVVLE